MNYIKKLNLSEGGETMKQKAILSNERGLTLVEILAALVILGIVFVGFMTVFPQMTNLNEKTETKLKTMNHSRILLNNLKKTYTSSEFQSYLTSENGYFLKDNETWIRNEDSEFGDIEYLIEKNPALTAGNAEGERSLYEVRISIKKYDKVISKTFGYIEVSKK